MNAQILASDDEFPRRGGRERRLIDIRRHDDRTAVGWLEDDFHHFGVTIRHDGHHVTDLSVATPRHPYTTCAAVGAPLKALVGSPLLQRASDIGRYIDMRLQCTHVFDLAGLVLAHIANGRIHRRYEATVEDREIVRWEADLRRTLGPGSATLRQDGLPVLYWEIDQHAITGPDAWAGQSLKEGFRERTEATDVESAEHAMVLRRAIMIAGGRSTSRASFPLPGVRSVGALCHTFQPGQREKALWIEGSEKNWQASSDGMLGHVEDVP